MFVSAIFRACLGFARLFFGRLFPLYSCLFVFVFVFFQFRALVQVVTLERSPLLVHRFMLDLDRSLKTSSRFSPCEQ